LDDDLRRRLDGLDRKLDAIGGYAEFHDAVERRFGENKESIRELRADLKELRIDHERDIEAVRSEAAADKKDRTMTWRQNLTGVLIPILVCLIGIIGAFLIALRSVKG
jgi:hypothetical protein